MCSVVLMHLPLFLLISCCTLHLFAISQQQQTWNLHADAMKSTSDIQRGRNLTDRVHVCGSAYTTSTPSTIEGALRSVMTMVRYFGSGDALWSAVCTGDVNEVYRTLADEESVAFSDEDHVDTETGCSLLHRACGDGSADIANLLIERGCRVDPIDSNGSTPLHYACVGGHAEVVEILLSADADVFAVDATGATPYDLARLQGHSKVLSTLSTRHLRRHWTRMHTAPPCQVPLAPVPRLFQEVVPQMEEDKIIMLSIQKAFQKFDPEGIGAFFYLFLISYSLFFVFPFGVPFSHFVVVAHIFFFSFPGAISTDHLEAVVTELQEPMTKTELEDMKINLDITRTGMVGFHDFHAFWTNAN